MSQTTLAIIFVYVSVSINLSLISPYEHIFRADVAKEHVEPICNTFKFKLFPHRNPLRKKT